MWMGVPCCQKDFGTLFGKGCGYTAHEMKVLGDWVHCCKRDVYVVQAKWGSQVAKPPPVLAFLIPRPPQSSIFGFRINYFIFPLRWELILHWQTMAVEASSAPADALESFGGSCWFPVRSSILYAETKECSNFIICINKLQKSISLLCRHGPSRLPTASRAKVWWLSFIRGLVFASFRLVGGNDCGFLACEHKLCPCHLFWRGIHDFSQVQQASNSPCPCSAAFPGAGVSPLRP